MSKLSITPGYYEEKVHGGTTKACYPCKRPGWENGQQFYRTAKSNLGPKNIKKLMKITISTECEISEHIVNWFVGLNANGLSDEPPKDRNGE